MHGFVYIYTLPLIINSCNVLEDIASYVYSYMDKLVITFILVACLQSTSHLVIADRRPIRSVLAPAGKLTLKILS